MTAYIYALYDPLTREIRYIGKTNNPKRRLWNHLYTDLVNKGKAEWIQSLIFIGSKPEMFILDELPHEDDSLWQDSERFWISYFRFIGVRLLNKDSGGNSGKRQSLETRLKISRANTGKKMSKEAVEKMIATKKANMTPELREKMAAINRGRKQSPELIAKRMVKMYGRVVSEETRCKISDAHFRFNQLNPKPKKPKPAPIPRKPISEETRMRLRLSHMGHSPSAETRAKMAAARIGIKRSPEICEKIRIGHLGKKKPRHKKYLPDQKIWV